MSCRFIDSRGWDIDVQIAPTADYPSTAPLVSAHPRPEDGRFSSFGEFDWGRTIRDWARLAGLGERLVLLCEELRVTIEDPQSTFEKHAQRLAHADGLTFVAGGNGEASRLRLRVNISEGNCNIELEAMSSYPQVAPQLRADPTLKLPSYRADCQEQWKSSLADNVTNPLEQFTPWLRQRILELNS